MRNDLSLQKAAEMFEISRCALTAAVKGKNKKKVGRPLDTKDQKKKLSECLRLQIPAVLAIRLIVKGILIKVTN